MTIDVRRTLGEVMFSYEDECAHLSTKSFRDVYVLMIQYMRENVDVPTLDAVINGRIVFSVFRVGMYDIVDGKVVFIPDEGFQVCSCDADGYGKEIKFVH